MTKKSDSAKDELLRPDKKTTVSAKDLLGSGATTLNLACSGFSRGAYPKGRYVLLAGVSDSAKTMLGLSAFAEATLRPEFDDYRFVYDAPEDGAQMDKAYFFGSKVKKRVESPRGTKSDPECSDTVEDFYDTLDRLFKEGTPFIYVLDSESALDSEAALKKQEKQRHARVKQQQSAGSYGDSKAKVHAQHLRAVRRNLRRTGSILIVISQLRENVGPGAMFEPHSRSGGTALKFFSDIEIWCYVKKTLKTKYHDKDRQQGIVVLAKVKRSRITGKKRNATFLLYHDHGIDDVGTCVDFLVEEKHWSKRKGIMEAPEFIRGERMSREDLIQYIEDNDLEQELQSVVKGVWREIDEAVAVRRKQRYS